MKMIKGLMKYFVDIDNTIATTPPMQYDMAQPIPDRIARINNLYDQGHEITYWTARGTVSGIDWTELTTKQLDDWGCRYHKLLFGKPDFDIFIDDKTINSETFFSHEHET